MVVLSKCVHAILRIPREERNFGSSFTNHPILNQGRFARRELDGVHLSLEITTAAKTRGQRQMIAVMLAAPNPPTEEFFRVYHTPADNRSMKGAMSSRFTAPL